MDSDLCKLNSMEKRNVIRAIKIMNLPENIDKFLLFNALCHTSYIFDKNNKERNIQSNERLEFLGDSVLELVISEFLYTNYKLNEGDMSKIRATVASEIILSDVAVKIGLNKFILLGTGEEKHGGRKKHSILADAFESLIAAIYISENFDTAKKFIIDNLYDYLVKSIDGELFLDYKTRLQEITQDVFKELPEYEVVSSEGPSHYKFYKISVKISGKNYGLGEGLSKKIAEQLAAKKACELLLKK